jgi:hypothetical protein
MKKILFIITICFSSLSLFAQWERIPGEGYDIGVGANGTAWVIGSGYSIHRWNGSAWQQMPSAASRIDVDPSGNAWVVNQGGDIFRWNGSGWVQISGSGSDIGIGANGTVWALGTANVGGGKPIMRWTGSAWQTVGGAATRIDVDPSGNPWVINNANQIFKWNGSGWTQVAGAGRDIGISADGTVWLVGTVAADGSFAIYRWTGSVWQQVSGGLSNISGGLGNSFWGTNQAANIWKYGAAAAPASSRVMTRFVPNIHGFKFYNDFTTNVLGIDFRGLCGGMAYSALDYFNNSIQIPSQTTTPPDGTTLRNYIYNRQQNSTSDNLDKWAELGVNPFGSRTQEFFNWGIQGYNGGRLEELKNKINAGTPVPLGLFKGGNGGFASHHQVLAIGYDTGTYDGRLGAGASQVKIFVYDSNFPNQMMTLVPNLGNQTYYYLEETRCSWMTYFVDGKYRTATPPRIP